MKKTIILPILMLFVSLANAQDDKAKQILDKVSAKTQDYESIYAKFQSNMKNKQSGINESQKGEIYIKGDKYKIDMGGQQVFSNGTKVWTYIKDENTCYVNYVSSDNGNSISPSEIFTIWESGYKYKYQKEATVNGKKTDIINLYPKKAESSKFHTIILSINKDHALNTIEIRGKDGTVMRYVVLEMKTNLSLDNSKFVFLKSKHPGVEMIEN